MARIGRKIGEEATGIQVRVELVAVSEADLRGLAHFGTYGFIHGGSGFLIGATSDGEAYLETSGFLMEKWVLMATDQGLGTCWLRKTFSKSSFAQKINTKEGELIPAHQMRGIERIIRRRAVTDRGLARKDRFFDQTFGKPLTQNQASDYAMPLEMVRLGPSASNNQPWRIVKEGRNRLF